MAGMATWRPSCEAHRFDDTDSPRSVTAGITQGEIDGLEECGVHVIVFITTFVILCVSVFEFDQATLSHLP